MQWWHVASDEKKSLCYFAFFCTNGCIWSGSFGKLWSCLTVMHSFVIFLPSNVRQATKSPPLQHCHSREYSQPMLIITIWLFVAGPSCPVDMWKVTFSAWQKAFQCPRLMLMVDAHQIWQWRTKTALLIGPSGGHADVFLCLPLFYRPTTCLPGITVTFQRDIWLWNKWTWAAQPPCHHGPRVHWIDALRVGRRFMFALPFPTWQPRFKWSHFTAKQRTKVSENI